MHLLTKIKGFLHPHGPLTHNTCVYLIKRFGCNIQMSPCKFFSFQQSLYLRDILETMCNRKQLREPTDFEWRRCIRCYFHPVGKCAKYNYENNESLMIYVKWVWTYKATTKFLVLYSCLFLGTFEQLACMYLLATDIIVLYCQVLYLVVTLSLCMYWLTCAL